ncbi:hypothetical protein RO21_02905 [[Actinobacillus] muris]|uniref:Protein TonB n=1 Tax=Muribacter muris TaxID=67855 RepID=A0A0J5P761_9PAST|nr:energy transducer TonB [Muribacter muris]KMK52086.1 hypothetical protein RO21_02905 [[Actinobacillus] muris] [Muribacter muris]
MKTHSRIGLALSILIHTIAFGGIWAIAAHSEPKIARDEVSSISMEMLAASLEQPQVAVAAEIEPESEPEEVEQPEPQHHPEPESTVPEPQPIKPKPIEKPKPKPPEKPKVKPKPDTPKKVQVQEKKPKQEKTEKPVKALEKGKESKQGIVAKAVPNATPSTKTQAGVANATTTGQAAAGVQKSVAGSDEINAYKALLKRTLQQRANNMYPQRERMMRKGGIVTVSFHFSSAGEISQVSVVNSSGNSNLDNAAVRATQTTRMSSPPPPNFPRTFTVPIKFSVQ